jgi:two-component system cell cycle sensor histidine kinase/response regulator CckA
MNLPRIMAAARPDSPFRVTLLYALVGTLWIVGSDGWMAWRMGATDEIWKTGILKGLLFVMITAGMLYLLARRLVRRHVAMEMALQENEERLALALEATNQGLFDWNIPAGVVVVNDAYATMLGYDPANFRESAAAWFERLHPGDLAPTKQCIDDYLAGRIDHYRAEFRLRTATGDWCWIHSRGRIVERDAAGRPVRMIGVHTDIHERKSSEARIMDALGFAKTILNSSPIGVLVYGSDGRTVTVNEAAAQLAGTDVSGLLRQNFREMASWRRYGLLAAAEEALATGKQVVHRGPFESSFGRSGWIEARFKPFYYQDSTHLLLLVTDESEKQQALAHLHLLDAAVQAAPVGWVVTDAEGVIKSVNPGFTALTGYTAGEVTGRTPRVLRSGRHSAEFYSTMWATIKRGEVWTGEMFNQRKDGGLYHESMTIAPVRDGDGIIRHFVAIKQDITERKVLENQLARAQRLEGIGMLASGIAHDLNNIFAPILLSLELLKIKYPMADARRMLDTIESAGQRGAGIVKQVLTFARGIEGERTEVQPKYLVKEMAQILGETLPRNIRVETEIAANLSPVLGDATQLHQVLLNLAINARDAMPVGGRLVLGVADVLVDESRAARNPPLKSGRCVAFTVTDTGGGIPPEVLERMFEPFFTTKPLGKGTGLGLSTVYGIVRSHGGAVEVKTRIGEGTEFCVLLPAMLRLASDPELVKPGPEKIQGAGRRILVVDDEPSIRIVTAAALQRHGFVVETAGDGAEGLVKLRQHGPFAAVLTDLMMPVMNGYDMAREIRRHDLRIPILASSGMTGDSTATQPEAGLAALGIKTLLIKPYAESDLLRALETELDPAPAEKKD